VTRPIQLLWNGVRLPIGAVLLLLEPLVDLICGAGLVLGLLTCLIFELSAVAPRFPLGQALMISVSFALILFLYHGLLSLLVED
jgi:hypothetical protein